MEKTRQEEEVLPYVPSLQDSVSVVPSPSHVSTPPCSGPRVEIESESERSME